MKGRLVGRRWKGEGGRGVRQGHGRLGRRPVTDGLGLQELGVQTDKKGFVTVEKKFRTNVLASTPSATSSAASCSPTRPRRRASPPSR